MMKQLTGVLALLLLAGCIGYSGTYKVADNLDTIPREIALKFLQDESGKYSDRHQCIFTNSGIGGIPYEELEYKQNTYGAPTVWVARTGEAGDLPLTGWEDIVICFPVALNVSTQEKYTDEEIQTALNKTCSALQSLGVMPFDAVR